MKVKLKTELLKGGRRSLFLNIYLGKGRYTQKSLKLYLIPEKTIDDKNYNASILHEANILRNETEKQILNKKLGKVNPRLKYDSSFLNFYNHILNHRYETGVNYDTWLSVKKHLVSYSEGEINFDDVNQIWLEGFKAHLKKKLAQNSAASYFNVLKNCIHRAFEEGIYENNPVKFVSGIRYTETEREYLTLDEIKVLRDSECRLPQLKKAFMFGCYTGLRWSDIISIKWGNIYKERETYYLFYKQKKTSNEERLPLSSDALKIIGKRGNDHDKIFRGLRYSAWHNNILANWVLKAGILKHISFHCSRHTHATLLLSHGVDIYTVSKLLGHKSIKTTEIYTRLLPQKRVEAIQKLPPLF